MPTEKTACPVVIYTRHHRIEGLMTLQKGERFGDKLNVADKQFESLSNARVFGIESGYVLHECPYLAVNKDQIILLMPVEAGFVE